MKNITTKGGMIFEIAESRKEILHHIGMLDFDPDWWDCDDSLFIQYKDGSYFYIGSDAVQEGKFRKNNIKAVIYSNANDSMIFGDYRIYNIDDIDEEYSEEVDTEEKFWNVDVA